MGIKFLKFHIHLVRHLGNCPLLLFCAMHIGVYAYKYTCVHCIFVNFPLSVKYFNIGPTKRIGEVMIYSLWKIKDCGFPEDRPCILDVKDYRSTLNRLSAAMENSTNLEVSTCDTHPLQKEVL